MAAGVLLGDRVDGIKALVAHWPRTGAEAAEFGLNRWWRSWRPALTSAGEGVEHGLGEKQRMMTPVNRTKTALSLEGEFFQVLSPPERVKKGTPPTKLQQKKDESLSMAVVLVWLAVGPALARSGHGACPGPDPDPDPSRQKALSRELLPYATANGGPPRQPRGTACCCHSLEAPGPATQPEMSGACSRGSSAV